MSESDASETNSCGHILLYTAAGWMSVMCYPQNALTFRSWIAFIGFTCMPSSVVCWTMLQRNVWSMVLFFCCVLFCFVSAVPVLYNDQLRMLPDPLLNLKALNDWTVILCYLCYVRVPPDSAVLVLSKNYFLILLWYDSNLKKSWCDWKQQFFCTNQTDSWV